MLGMSSRDLREEIYKAASENPALEIVRDPLSSSTESFRNHSRVSAGSADSLQAALEAQEDHGETLQQHLMEQLNLSKVSKDEYDLCQKLIYNLDKDGFYGKSLSPQSLLDKTRPVQNLELLEKCMFRVQNMDPVGTCCRSWEESLFVQAKIAGDASPLTLFLLDNHLDLLTPADPEKIAHNLVAYRKSWHSKSFAPELPIDKLLIDAAMCQESLDYIRKLNPHPAGNYISDVSQDEFNAPDVVLKVTKEKGSLTVDDFENGRIAGEDGYYFQVAYASGSLPEIRITKELMIDKENVEKAKQFIENLKYRESTIALQGCAIVAAQREFFMYGTAYLKPLLRKQIAQQLGIHESTVSRLSSKSNSKFMETPDGLYPLKYFFGSSVPSAGGGERISNRVIQEKILEFTKAKPGISDSELTKLLNHEGIKIARRTVAKYRQQAGIKNSYSR